MNEFFKLNHCSDILKFCLLLFWPDFFHQIVRESLNTLKVYQAMSQLVASFHIRVILKKQLLTQIHPDFTFAGLRN